VRGPEPRTCSIVSKSTPNVSPPLMQDSVMLSDVAIGLECTKRQVEQVRRLPLAYLISWTRALSSEKVGETEVRKNGNFPYETPERAKTQW